MLVNMKFTVWKIRLRILEILIENEMVRKIQNCSVREPGKVMGQNKGQQIITNTHIEYLSVFYMHQQCSVG